MRTKKPAAGFQSCGLRLNASRTELRRALRYRISSARRRGRRGSGSLRPCRAAMAHRAAGLWNAVLDRTGLPRQTAALNGGHRRIHLDAGNRERLGESLQNRTREIGVHFLAVDRDLARARLDPTRARPRPSAAGRIGLTSASRTGSRVMVAVAGASATAASAPSTASLRSSRDLMSSLMIDCSGVFLVHGLDVALRAMRLMRCSVPA